MFHNNFRCLFGIISIKRQKKYLTAEAQRRKGLYLIDACFGCSNGILIYPARIQRFLVSMRIF